MLTDIKSIEIFIKVFSYIKGETSLKIIKYNKSFQNIMNIDLIDYKILSGKYIVYEQKGKAKEIDSYNNQIIFGSRIFKW